MAMCRLFLARTYMLKMVQTEPYEKEQLMIIVYRVNSPPVGHGWNVSRSSGLAKTILQGTVKGGRRQGRQRKRREDNIREWTSLEFGSGEQGKMEKTGRKDVCGALTTLAVKGLMMIMMMMNCGLAAPLKLNSRKQN